MAEDICAQCNTNGSKNSVMRWEEKRKEKKRNIIEYINIIARECHMHALIERLQEGERDMMWLVDVNGDAEEYIHWAWSSSVAKRSRNWVSLARSAVRETSETEWMIWLISLMFLSFNSNKKKISAQQRYYLILNLFYLITVGIILLITGLALIYKF